jgi:hypothetical protein
MTKRTFNIFITLTFISACNFFNNYQLPDNYIGVMCDNQENCIEVDGSKILKEPILKIEYSNASLNGKKQMTAMLDDSSKNELKKMLKDYQGKNIVFFHKDAKLADLAVYTDDINHIILNLNRENIDAKKLCVDITKSCNTESYDADIAEMNRRTEIEKNLRQQYAQYESIEESHHWKAFEENITVFPTEDDKNSSTREVSRLSILQDYDLKQDRFVFKNNKIKSNIGWIHRKAIYPMNIATIKPILERNYKEYLQQLKCLRLISSPEPLKIVSMMKRSTEVALIFMNQKEFENLKKQTEKNIESFKCQ